MDEDLWLKTTFDNKKPLMEDSLQRKLPSMEDNC